MKRYSFDAILNTILSTWNDSDLDDVFTRAFDRIKCVLILTNEVNMCNDLVEIKRDEVHDDIIFYFTLNSKTFAPANAHTIIVADEDDYVYVNISQCL